MERYKKVNKASILGVTGNLFLFIIKGIVGFITHSQAMIADAFNSLGDILSSVMTYVGNKISSKPSDDDHNLGHGKAEYIYSLLISVVMFLMGVKVLVDSIKALIFGSVYNFSYWLIIICIVTIIVKFFLYVYTYKLAKIHKNLLLEANSKDHRNDCVIATCNLIACLFSLKGIYYIDSTVGLFISIWIIKVGIEIFVNSYDVLMDKSIDADTKQKVFDIIKKYEEVKKINHFNSTPVGYQYQISFTIFVDGNLSTFESHDIANKIEKEIDKAVPEVFLTVIHVNPIDINN